MKKISSILILLSIVAVLLSSCNFGGPGGPKTIVTDVTLPEVYYLEYGDVSEKGQKPEFIFAQACDAHGNEFAKFTTGTSESVQLIHDYYILQENGRYKRYYYQNGELQTHSSPLSSLAPELQTISKSMMILYPFFTDYVCAGFREFDSVKELGDTTIAGRDCKKYEVTIVSEINRSYSTTVTYEISIDKATGLTLSEILLHRKSLVEDEDYYSGFICTRFDTEGFDFSNVPY